MTPTRKTLALVAGLMAMALSLTACSNSSSTSSGGGGSSSGGVSATEKDFSITLGTSSGPAGSTTFNIKNEGPSAHEFVVIKTDLAPDALPVKSSQVDENASGLSTIGRIQSIPAGSTANLTADLTAGSYVVICNLPGHYQQGMRAAFTVS